MSTISQKVNDAIAALTAVNYVLDKEQSYRKAQVLAARAKKLCQEVKAQARSAEMRKCEHLLGEGHLSLHQGRYVKAYRCGKCGKANVRLEEVHD